MTTFLPGISSFVEHLDKDVLVVLYDGRNYIGKLRSFDQYGNLFLQECYERRVVHNVYSDFLQGNHVVRGENVVIFGELRTASDPSPSSSSTKTTTTTTTTLSEEEFPSLSSLSVKSDQTEAKQEAGETQEEEEEEEVEVLPCSKTASQTYWQRTMEEVSNDTLMQMEQEHLEDVADRQFLWCFEDMHDA
jgi:small nuclear ribonucleoprotein (snRNP)-like protein